MNGRRVVVTGIGIVAACGVSKAEFWESVKRGHSGIRPIESFDGSIYQCKTAAEVASFNIEDRHDLDKASRLLLAACGEALSDSRLLDPRHDNPRRFAIAVGTIHAGLISLEGLYPSITSCNPSEIVARQLQECALFAPSLHVNREFPVKGPKATLTMACASGTAAIGYGTSLIKNARADRVLAGGVDTVNEFVHSGFHSLRALSPSKCSPFDRNRDGMILGEGAAMLVLEDYNCALARDATVYAEVTGYGFSGDAAHISAPDRSGEGLANAIRWALADGDLVPRDVDYINAHGVGTLFGDAMESEAIWKVFGECCPPISSTKPLTGHTMGAAGAIEAVVCLLAMNDRFIPGTLNYDQSDGRRSLNIIRAGGQEKSIEVSLSTSAGFGGQNAAVVFSRLLDEKRIKKISNISQPRARVVITGIGLVSHSAIGRAGSLRRDNPLDKQTELIEEVRIRLQEALDEKAAFNIRQMDHLSMYAVLAASLALQDADLCLPNMDPSQIGIVLGTGLGSIYSEFEYLRRLTALRNPLLASATTFRNTTANIAAAQVSIAFGIKGVNATLTSGEASGATAIGYAYDLIRSEKAKMILCGVTQSTPDELKEWLTEANLVGSHYTDGAVLFALERSDSADARHAKIYCDIAGVGLAEGYSNIEEGISLAMRSALDEAKVKSDEVEYIYPARSKYPQEEQANAILGASRPESMAFGSPSSIASPCSYITDCVGLSALIKAINSKARIAVLNSIAVDGNCVSIAIRNNSFFKSC